MSEVTAVQLIRHAHLALKYSTVDFRMGAALLTEDNKIFTGCNIYNIVEPCCMCAERVAIFKAVSDGFTKFKALAVVGEDNAEVSICGCCRQVLRQYSTNMKLHCSDGTDNFTTYNLGELLPHSYGPNMPPTTSVKEEIISMKMSKEKSDQQDSSSQMKSTRSSEMQEALPRVEGYFSPEVQKNLPEKKKQEEKQQKSATDEAATY